MKARRITQLDIDPDRPSLIVNCYSYGSEYRWVEPELEERGLSFRSFQMSKTKERQPRGIHACMRAVAAAVANRTQTLLISHQTPATDACGAMLRALPVRIPHLAYSWHYPDLPRKRERMAYWVAKPKVDAYVLHSDIEVQNGHKRLGAPLERLYMAPWQYEETPGLENEPPLVEGDYVLALGGSDRDYATAVEAMRRLPDLKMVLVCRPENITGLDIPPNVHVMTEIPRLLCWNLVQKCRAFLLTLLTPDSHCGHSVLVQAMHYGRPCIVTDARSMDGYVEDGVTAQLCAVKDSVSVVEAIERLWNDTAYAATLGENARRFATENLSPDAVADFFLASLGWQSQT